MNLRYKTQITNGLNLEKIPYYRYSPNCPIHWVAEAIGHRFNNLLNFYRFNKIKNFPRGIAIE